MKRQLRNKSEVIMKVGKVLGYMSNDSVRQNLYHQLLMKLLIVTEILFIGKNKLDRSECVWLMRGWKSNQ